MKNLKTILIAVIAIFAFACTQKPSDFTLISGKIENVKEDKFVIMAKDRSTIEVAVAEDGTFADTIFQEGELIIPFQKSMVKFYAINGAKLIINADAEDLPNSIQISGEKAGMSNYMLQKSIIQNEMMRDMKAVYSADEATFWANAKEFLAKQEALLENAEDVSVELKELEKRALKAAYTSSLGMYSNYHGYFSGNKEYEASEELQKAAANIDYTDGELYKYSQDYQRLLMGDSQAKAAKLMEAGEAKSHNLASLLVAEKMENETIREAMLFASVEHSFARAEYKDELYEKYMALAKDEKNRNIITEKYNAVSKLDKGQPSPKFFDYENYAGGTSSLDDFKGKYVYIDVWATWCGPCKAEIPHLKTVEEKYHGRNIEFVSISVDKENAKETWRNMIAEKEMGGVQLISTDKENKFMDDYVIAGIPRFILIDPEGNIVEKNAPRPSDPKLVELFTELGI